MPAPSQQRIYGAIACLALCLSLLPQAAFAEQAVRLQLRWDHQFQFAGYYEALWQGYYAEEDLDVEIVPAVQPDGSILSAVEEVSSGRADFGIGAGDILMAQDKGFPLVILASILQQSGVGFYSLESTPMIFPSDLMHLRVAHIPGDLPDVEFQTMLRQEGISPERIRYVPLKPGMQQLLSGEADVIPGYRITAPYVARSNGIELNAIYPFSYGITFYGDSLFTRRELLDERQKVVESFTRASLRGWEYALTHPEHTARRIATRLKRSTPVDNALAFNLFQAREIRSLTHYPYIPMGHINPLRWQRMHDHLQTSGLVQNPFPTDAIYDPQRASAQRRHRWLVFIVALSIAGSALTMLLLLWVFTLRRTVRARTSELEESREHYRTVADFTYDWEYWLGPNNELLYVSPSCERVSGYSAEEFQRDPDLLLRIVHPEEREAFRDHVKERHAGIGARHMEFRILRSDGQTRWIGHVCQQIFSSSGEWLGERGSNRDISDSKLQEAKREEVERILRHDLRSPLLSLYAGLKMITGGALSSTETDKIMPELLQSTRDLIDMMDALHSLSRMENDTYTLKRETMDLYDLLTQAAKDVPHSQHIRLAPLPEGLDETPFIGDRGLCRSMLTNLLRNAVEARGEQDVTARLDVNDGDYLIAIHNALPVPQEMRQCFFDKFATSGKSQGTGLGTYSARLAASIHGGEISFKTSEEHGTTVNIRLPRDGAPEQE